MNFEIKPATRQGVKPLVGFYGKSGSGKTMSALLFARGIVGDGRITLIDSESGRGSIFADIIPGGYQIINIDPPFSPERYQEAIETAETASDCVVVDSLSHAWSGEGGVLDMQEDELDRMAGKDNWAKREQCKMASWVKPKMAHKKFVQRLLRCKSALICCLRGEEKTHITKGQDGKSKVITDEFSSPLYDPRFIFELLLNFETIAVNGKGGFVIPRKVTHPDIATLLPKENEQIGVRHGAALSTWCSVPRGPGSAARTATTKPVSTKTVSDLKKKLWHLTVSKHHDSKKALEQWLWDEAIISDTEALEELSDKRLAEVICKCEDKLREPQPA